MAIGEAMAMMGHRTVVTFQSYYQSAAIRRSKVASMLDATIAGARKSWEVRSGLALLI